MTTRASQRSNAPARAALPDAPLRGRVLLALALGWLVEAVVALSIHGWLGTSAAPPLIAFVVFAAMSALVLATMRDRHPFADFGAANQVTLLRGALIAVAAGAVAEPPSAAFAWAIVLTTIVVASLDGVDGWLARRSNMSSVFGARFDMETDAFFMLVLSILAWRHGKAGVWVLGIGLMRYLFVAAGWLLPWLARPLRATLRGKTMAVVTLVALGLSLAPAVSAGLSTLVCALALAALSWSFSVDIAYLWRHRRT